VSAPDDVIVDQSEQAPLASKVVASNESNTSIAPKNKRRKRRNSQHSSQEKPTDHTDSEGMKTMTNKSKPTKEIVVPTKLSSQTSPLKSPQRVLVIPSLREVEDSINSVRPPCLFRRPPALKSTTQSTNESNNEIEFDWDDALLMNPLNEISLRSASSPQRDHKRSTPLSPRKHSTPISLLSPTPDVPLSLTPRIKLETPDRKSSLPRRSSIVIVIDDEVLHSPLYYNLEINNS